MKTKLKNIAISTGVFLIMPFIMATTVYAQGNPTAEINSIVERIITIATQVGSGILILFIIKDGIDFGINRGNAQFQGKLARDIFFLLLAALFLFKPDFILDAIKYIANV